MTQTKMLKRLLLFFVFTLLIIFYASFLIAEPLGPSSVTAGTPQSRGSNAAYQVKAYAGNLTQLVIDGTTVTNSWQGYYGNISGTITLDDASNFTMYDWSVASPQGEVYAANFTTVTWANIKCVNFTSNGSADINRTELEDMFGMNRWDPDGMNRTFNRTYSDSTGFYVGSIQINSADSCPMIYTYVNDTYQNSTFEEVLLTDNSTIVFTALLEQDAMGFNNKTYDFQMIVGDNGHSGDTTAISYYFFAEIQ